MRALLRASLLSIAPAVAMNAAVAFERGATFTVLPGTTMGLPYAYTGTPGVYFYNLGNFATGPLARDVQPNLGKGSGYVQADIVDEVPAFVWTTPYKLFGATYAILVSQPVAGVTDYGAIPGAGWLKTEGGGMRNTIVSPINLSWNLGNGFHIGTGFNTAIPDARTYGPNGLNAAGQPYWTLEPNIGVSYLRDGYDLSATLLYDFYTRNTYSNVLNGQGLILDLTATKKFGPFEIGPVGYLGIQTTRDSGGNPLQFLATSGNINSCEAEPGGIYNYCVRAAKAGVGGKLGYDFGRGEIAILATQSVFHHGQGASDGWHIWTQLSFKLYDEHAHPPLAMPFLESFVK